VHHEPFPELFIIKLPGRNIKIFIERCRFIEKYPEEELRIPFEQFPHGERDAQVFPDEPFAFVPVP
jgi:hypothetical protein